MAEITDICQLGKDCIFHIVYDDVANVVKGYKMINNTKQKMTFTIKSPVKFTTTTAKEEVLFSKEVADKLQYTIVSSVEQESGERKYQKLGIEWNVTLGN